MAKFIKINGKDFKLPKPSPRQKTKFLELLGALKINYASFVQVSNRMKGTEYANEADSKVMVDAQIAITESKDFDAKLAAIWLVENSKSFTESFETNYDEIYEYAMDNSIEGVSFANFISQMF